MKSNEATSDYGGTTKRKYKKKNAIKGSTPGSSKGDNYKADGLQKGVIKHPRFYKTDPVLYMRINAATDKAAKGRKTLSGETLTE